jgi:hypothetical protein
MSSLRDLSQQRDRLLVNYPQLTTTGDMFEGWEYPDKTIQASGTGTVTLQGSNDGTNFVALNDIAGVAISLAAASNAASVVLANPKWMRAVCAGGTAAVTITCAK